MNAPLRQHLIICGEDQTADYLLTGIAAMAGGDHAATGIVPRRCVAIVSSPAAAARLSERHPEVECLVGDATTDEALGAAGVTEAHGLFPVLPEDKENLFITFSARQLNPHLRIVARVKDLLVNGPKFRLAGANVVVSPAFSGGLRLASEAARPHATDFLDLLLRDTACEMNLREVALPAGSFPCGKSLAQIELTRRHRVLVLAIRPNGADLPSYNPSAATVLLAGDRLALYGRLADLNALETRIREEVDPTAAAPSPGT